MFGPDLTIDIDEKFIINAQYVRRTDSDVILDGFPSEVMEDVVTQGLCGGHLCTER